MAASLWKFASTYYLYPGVAELCLTLQDIANADINMLLTAAWLGNEGHRWEVEEVQTIVLACERWRAICLLPLRKMRRDLKELVGADNWYQRIKALELEAERQQLQWIEDATLRVSEVSDTTDRTLVIADNLAVYLATLPAIQTGQLSDEAKQLTQLLTAAIKIESQKSPQ
jgi:uncharacterized protein (TIGR02444 family)